MADVPAEKPKVTAPDAFAVPHEGDKPKTNTAGDIPPQLTPAATARPGAAAAESQPAWISNFQKAGEAIVQLSALKPAGEGADVVAKRQTLGETAERNLWQAFANGQSDATGSAAGIFNGLSDREHYQDRMRELARDPQVAPELKKQGINGATMKPEDVQRAIINMGIASGPGSDLANNPVARKLTEYLTLSEADSLAARHVGQAQEANKAPLMAGVALAEYALEHGNGVLPARDAKGEIIQENGKPKMVTAAQILDFATNLDSKMDPAVQPTQQRVNISAADLVSQYVPKDRNPQSTLMDALLTKNPADFERAYKQAQAPEFSPENIQKRRDEVQQQQTAGQITAQQAQLRSAGLDLMSTMRARTEYGLGQSMLGQPNPDFDGALTHMRNGATAFPGLIKDGDKTPDQIVQAARAVDKFNKDHPDLAAIQASPEFRKLAASAFTNYQQANLMLAPKGADGKPITDAKTAPVPLTPETISGARGLLESAYSQSATMAGMLDSQRQTIDTTYGALAQKQNRTPEEDAQLRSIAPMYEALHLHTMVGARLGAIYSSTGDPHLGQHMLEEAQQDKAFFANSPGAQTAIEHSQAQSAALIEQQAGFWSKYGKWVGFGLAAAGAVAVSAITFGVAAPEAAAGVIALGAAMGLGEGASVAVGAGVGYGLSVATGATVGATLESQYVPGIGSYGDGHALAESWGEGFRDSIGPAFKGAALGGMLPLMAAPAAVAAGETTVAAGVGTQLELFGAADLGLAPVAAAAPAAEVVAGVAAPAAEVAAAAAPSELAAGVGAQGELFGSANLGMAPVAEAAGATAPATNAASAARGFFARQFYKIPGVEPALSNVGNYTGYNWAASRIASIEAPQQELVNSLAARMGGGRLANVALRAGQYTAMGSIATLPNLFDGGPSSYFQELSMYPLTGGLGVPLAGKGSGLFSSVGWGAVKVGGTVGADVARNASNEYVSPLTNSGDFWGHVAARTGADFMDPQSQPFFFWATPQLRPFVPMRISATEDVTRQAVEQDERTQRERAAKAAAAELAAKQHPLPPK